MFRLTEKRLIKEMKAAYQRRLLRSINEADVRDKQGNIIIKPGLKVRHKKSGFEYTVIRITKDPRTGKAQVHLRSPESPRFEPNKEEFLGEDRDAVLRDLEDTINSIGASKRLSEPDFEVLVVDERDFEKNYEVK